MPSSYSVQPESLRTWNKGAERIKGYRAEEVVGKHFSMFYTEQAKSTNHPAFELEEALKKVRMRKKDGELRRTAHNFGRVSPSLLWLTAGFILAFSK